MGGTNPTDKRELGQAHGGIIPMGIATILCLAILLSLLFIISISFAFMGSDGDEPYFKTILNSVAENSPGVYLFNQPTSPSRELMYLFDLDCPTRRKR